MSLLPRRLKPLAKKFDAGDLVFVTKQLSSSEQLLRQKPFNFSLYFELENHELA